MPPNFYHGLGGHGYYFRDSVSRKDKKLRGSTVHDPAWVHPAWLNPEWDPYTVLRIRGSGYQRIAQSFEGFEPKSRGEWHTYQWMMIPSQKDAKVGWIKVWIDGELAFSAKSDTIPAYNIFWISNYWHSQGYVGRDTVSNTFETHTAPAHPVFEIFTDNIIVSKRFIEFGPGKAQIERVRFADFKKGAFTVHFDTSMDVVKISAECGGKTVAAEATAPGYFHSLKIKDLKPGKNYQLRLSAVDKKGRKLVSTPIAFKTADDNTVPDFQFPDWKGEVYQGHDFEATPAYIRNFKSLSHVAWPGQDSDDLVDTSKHMTVRYSKTAAFKAGSYLMRINIYDGIRVAVDGEVKTDKMRATGGRKNRPDIPLELTEGQHTLEIDHMMWRKDNWEKHKSKHLAFAIGPKDTTAPQLYAQDIYNSRFHRPEQPLYAGRWSEPVSVTIDYGLTAKYGQQLKSGGRFPTKRFPALEIETKYHYRVTAVDRSGNKTVTPDATFTCGDTIPPGKIMLTVERVSDDQIKLKFRALGEDGRHGTAASYDIRYATEPLTIGNWSKATRAKNIPAPQKGKTKEEITLSGLPRGKTYYFAIQAIDKAGLKGLLSNIASDPPGPEIMDIDGDGYGAGSLKGPDPDDYDAAVPGRQSSLTPSRY